ncbi:MFS transporter [Curtobacterium sp. MCBD17_034]|uniref:MFS transporter n=1 Tax=unclassified Curtobacterium TaxID=257496 RepID=UPI000DA9F26F|nr:MULTISPECIES: MFS transporter [unclassified Curtobacterium]PZF61143.1 MFS transporter [Curtobacterium sp. MCBD17_034]PZM40492.1 MFS transporter [Curtobacterium sp. MCBD17_031]
MSESDTGRLPRPTAPSTPGAGRPRRAAPPDRFDRRLLAPMMLGSILNPINSSIIAVALVPIAAAFGAPASETAWLVSALYLATSIGQPLVGRLVDTFGPRRLFLVGAVLTLVAGVIGTAAPGLGWLVAARVVLGFGTCAGYPAAMTLIRAEGRRTGQDSPQAVLTALAVTTQTIAVIGPTLGGLLIAVGGWRATFAVNIPLGVACLVLGWVALPRHTALDATRTRARFDVAGVLLFAATLLALLLFLMDLRPALVWLLVVAVAAAVAFTVRELRAVDPFIDVRVFAGNLPLLGTFARALVAQVVSYAFLYGFTQWLEDGRGLSASAAGLVLLPLFGAAIVVSTLTGRRPEVRAKLVVGGVLLLVGCVLLLAVGSGTAVWLLFALTTLVGIPLGLLNLANQNALYHQADPERVGASAGLLRTFSYLGAIVASASGGAAFGARATTPGLHELAWIMVVAAAVLVALTLADRSLAALSRPARTP